MYKFEVFVDKAGEYRWRLRASNGQIIATGGEGYKEKSSALNGVKSVMSHAAEAQVIELEAEAKKA